MTQPVGKPHNGVLGNLTERPAGGDGNPLFSFSPEVLDTLTAWVGMGDTMQAAFLPYLTTHEPHIEHAINHARHLDEALIILWDHIARQLDVLYSIALDPDAPPIPRITTAKEIRLWMADPNNAPLLDTVKTLNLSNNGLKVIPPEINNLRELRALDLGRNQITQIYPETFANCGALQYLFLNNNQILQIAPQAFANCGALQCLQLEHNQIVRVSPQIFAGCTALTGLYLNNNQIAQIAPQAFANCGALLDLNLGHNQIAQIDPEVFAGCRMLHTLTLHYNQITQIACQTFADCVRMQRLYLNHNQIIQIDPEVFAGCQALLWLGLNHNQIAKINLEAFAGCQALLWLNLNHNQIAQVDPAVFADCPALEALYLEHNQIAQIDPHAFVFAGCQRLRKLELLPQRISKVVDLQAFVGCEALHKLRLRDNPLLRQLASEAEVENPLLSLPPDLLNAITEYVATGKTPQAAAANAIQWGLASISSHLMTHESHVAGIIAHAKRIALAKHLDQALIILWHRSIARQLRGEAAFPAEMSTAAEIRGWMADPNNAGLLDTISGVSLVNCGLKVIPPEINALRNLQKLRLENNQITQIGPRAFAGCRALAVLHLEHNRIAQIDPQAFAGCRALQALSLQNNQITQISAQTFISCRALEELYLWNNQIAQVSPQAFAGCPALRILHIWNNKLSKISSHTFADCPALRTLQLEGNQITQVDRLAFAGCLSLQYLYLSNNQITEVSSETFASCRTLLDLHLKKNKIARIDPGAFVGCLSLRELQLDHNQITQIGPHIFAGNTALQYLHLEHNKIAQIDPGAFAGCVSLQQLYLQNNLLLCTPGFNKRNCLHEFNTFSEYVCRSQLAVFYKALSEGRLSALEIVEHLKHLEDRNLIYEMVYWEAKATAKKEKRAFSTDGDLQWGEHHVCDDMPIFYRALKRAVQEKFDRLSAEQKQRDPDLSQNPREENVLRFIDAMTGV